MGDYLSGNLEAEMESSKIVDEVFTYSVKDPEVEGDLKYKKLHILQQNTARCAIHKASS